MWSDSKEKVSKGGDGPVQRVWKSWLRTWRPGSDAEGKPDIHGGAVWEASMRLDEDAEESESEAGQEAHDGHEEGKRFV